jgi:hypothetical protein
LVKAIGLQLSGRYIFGHHLEELLVSQRVVYLFVLVRVLLQRYRFQLSRVGRYAVSIPSSPIPNKCDIRPDLRLIVRVVHGAAFPRGVVEVEGGEP